MVLTSLQAQPLINWFNRLNMNQPVQMTYVNYLLIPNIGNINPGYPTGVKLYPWGTKYIDKETDKLYTSVSNPKEIVDQFLSLGKKYGWVRLSFMIRTDTSANNFLE